LEKKGIGATVLGVWRAGRAMGGFPKSPNVKTPRGKALSKKKRGGEGGKESLQMCEKGSGKKRNDQTTDNKTQT